MTFASNYKEPKVIKRNSSPKANLSPKNRQNAMQALINADSSDPNVIDFSKETP
jgi:hypothetical protein